MVATRNHPQDFEAEPTASPTKRTTCPSSANENHASPTKAAAPPSAVTKSRSTASAGATSSRSEASWSHTPSNLTLLWHAIGLPLVIWDTGYVLLRPYSMPGGPLHYPLWAPYALYGRIDWSYGLEAWQTGYGWTAAQGTMNALETTGYLVYLYLVYAYGQQETTQGRGAPDKGVMGALSSLSESRTLYGEVAAWAVVLGYTTAQITFWKTVLYWLIELFSGFHGIGHNDWATLLFMWIIPNGAWLAFPAYMIYVTGQEILQGLVIASGESKKAR